MKNLIFLISLLSCISSVIADGEISRVFRAPRFTRDSLNVHCLQPIDEAAWIWRDKQDTPAVCVFRCPFEVKEGEEPFLIDVSADERFYLTVDGTFIARGPNRGSVENWQYQTYRLRLPPGRHEMRAVVTRLGTAAPLAQLSHRGGLVLKAEGVYDQRLTTGRAKWQVGTFSGMRMIGKANGVWGTGEQVEVNGSGPYVGEPKAWSDPVVVREVAFSTRGLTCGLRKPGWMLFPSQLPDQTENKVRPGSFRAATKKATWREEYTYQAVDTNAAEVVDFNGLLKANSSGLKIPAHTRLQLAWHLGRYFCAYPLLSVSAGEGTRISWTWTESPQDMKTQRKGDRREIVGKGLQGYGDVFISDGRPSAVFSSPWFRCGLWCRIDIETRESPLVINEIALIESRYPLEDEGAFVSADDPSLTAIREISTRAMQMCAHEMLFDCPYYEQQMYPGDTRIQLNVLTALTQDDRLVRRAIEILDLAQRDDGQCPFNFPTRGTQEGFTYTLAYLCMFGDYVMNHANREWLRARIPGMRKALAGCELYENAEGLLEHTPGWNFMDWVEDWPANGTLPNCQQGYELNAFVNLFWILAMQSGAQTERALGNELQARYWEQKIAQVKAKVVETFWSESRGLLADTPAKKTFSEHMQALAIMGDVLDSARAKICFDHLITDAELSCTTVYFNYYLFGAYFKMGRADLFLKRLDLWRGYLEKGLTTLSEKPDTPTIESRSDCHAWGAHPIHYMQTGLAGIAAAAPFFQRVRIAPQPGGLKSFTARHPHPEGFITVSLSFAGDQVTGKVETPVPGVFLWQGHEIQLTRGVNHISLFH